MLTVIIDPNVPPADRPGLFARTVRTLRAAAIDAGHEVADVLATVDAGRLVVDADLYAGLDDDEGLLVVDYEAADLNPGETSPEVAAEPETAPEVEAPKADAPKVEDLKGKALDEALKAAGLPTSGSADEKRARLAEHTNKAGDTGSTNNEE